MSNTKFTIQNFLNGMANVSPDVIIYVLEHCNDFLYGGRFDECPEEVYTRIVRKFFIPEITDHKITQITIEVYRDMDLY